MKWFAYSNATYYPDAVIVEADDVAGVQRALEDEGYPTTAEGLVVFPLEALALWVPAFGGEQLLEDALEALP